MARKRVFLLGSARAEFEHVHGPLVVDEADPRFVLVDEETEALIRNFPPGVPPHSDQDFEVVKRIRAAELDIAGVDHDFGDSGAAEAVREVHKGDRAGLEQDGGKSVAQSSRPVLNENPAYGEREFLAAEAESDAEDSEDEVDASPAAVELAEAEGVDLSEVEGSGSGGRVVKSDVEEVLAEREE